MLLFPQLGYSAKPRNRASNLPNLISHCVTNNEPKLCLPLYKGFASVRILLYQSERCPPNGVFCVGALGTGSIKYAEALCRSLRLSSESFFQVFSFNSKKPKRKPLPYPSPKVALGQLMAGLLVVQPQPALQNVVKPMFFAQILSSLSSKFFFQIFLPNLCSKFFNSKKPRKKSLPIPLPRGCARLVDGNSPGAATPTNSSKCCKPFWFSQNPVTSVSKFSSKFSPKSSFSIHLDLILARNLNLSSKSFFQVICFQFQETKKEAPPLPLPRFDQP